MVALPRLMVAAPSTGQGKTTVATGLMAALRIAGHEVSGHKVGPDYIDPGYHALATGRSGRNLDPHLVGEERVVPLLLHGAADADLAVIEGVMGLYDGRLGTDGFSSTAHVATLTQTPVVLVIDIARLSRSAAAIAAGMASYDTELRIAGVFLNRAGSQANTFEITRALERTGLPVLGVLPNDDQLTTPSRHLGLVPVAERDESAQVIEHLGEQLVQHLDLDALRDVARQAPPLDANPWDPSAEVRQGGTSHPTVAMASGRAFTFRYAETEELLRAAGCEIVAFDPLTDPALPTGTAGIYLGGGFPQLHAAGLAANASLLDELRAAVADGMPTVAECAGLLYLAESLDELLMAAAIPTRATMSERLMLRYPVATAVADTLLTRVGDEVTGHEFHRTQATPEAGATPAWKIGGAATGFANATSHASYLHVHWAGHPQLAQRFADAVHAAASSGAPTPPAVPTLARRRVSLQGQDSPATTYGPGTPLDDPLRHHGDTETGSDLLDFAVNVFDAPRPTWLDQALHDSLTDVAAYPDAEPARNALALWHGRHSREVLPTAGAAEAFTLLARLRHWRRPVVVHPQFTEPHAALEQAGHTVNTVLCRAEDGFALDPAEVREEADLVVLGNPTNPTGVLHPAPLLRGLRRPGRLLVVDEAFMDAVPGETESLVRERLDDIIVVRSLTKHWTIPGIRAGYVIGDPSVVRRLEALQTPWSVSAPAIAAMMACTTEAATAEACARAATLGAWRGFLETALSDRGIDHVPSAASFVLAHLGEGAHGALRSQGIAVRRADTFPGLDAGWVRIAVRPHAGTRQLLAALDRVIRPLSAVPTA
jgi:cobyrinic acid a,c-diamide synthase